MALTHKDRQYLADFLAEREGIETRRKMLDKLISAFHEAESKNGTGPQQVLPARKSRKRRTRASRAEGGSTMIPLREAIRKYLKAASGPKTSPDITRALVAAGNLSNYQTGKMNTDGTLQRMRKDGDLVKDDDGWQLARS